MIFRSISYITYWLLLRFTSLCTSFHWLLRFDSIRLGLRYVLITKVASVSSSSNFSNFSTLTYGWHDVGKMNVWLFAVATVSICCTDTHCTVHTIRTHTNHIENRNGFLHTVFFFFPFFFLLLQTILNAPSLCHRLFSFDFLLYCRSQEIATSPSVHPSSRYGFWIFIHYISHQEMHFACQRFQCNVKFHIKTQKFMNK